MGGHVALKPLSDERNGHAVRRLCFLKIAFIFTLFTGAVAQSGPSKDSPAMKMLQCDSCRAVMHELSKDVKFLVESDKMWKPKDLLDRIRVSCTDPNIAKGAMKDACGVMMTDFHEAMAREITLRWTEDSDEFEEDIVPAEFCEKLGICREGHSTLNEMITRQEKKDKDLKEEKEEKERAMQRKKAKKS